MSETAPVIADLLAKINELETLDDVARITRVRALSRTVPTAFQAFADELTYELTRVDSNATIAARLGVSVGSVEVAITRHRKRIAD